LHTWYSLGIPFASLSQESCERDIIGRLAELGAGKTCGTDSTRETDDRNKKKKKKKKNKNHN